MAFDPPHALRQRAESAGDLCGEAGIGFEIVHAAGQHCALGFNGDAPCAGEDGSDGEAEDCADEERDDGCDN
ncbi:hypothetical protein GCM10027344_24940 [Spelaeicoccus albus]